MLTYKQVKEKVTLGRRQIDRLEAVNQFPRRVPLSSARVAWIEDEIEEWLKNRIKARSTEVGALGSGRKIKAARDRA